MNPTTVIRCRGIGEPLTGRTFLHDVTDQLHPAEFRAVELPWAATYGPIPGLHGPSFDESLAEGRALLLAAITEAPGKVALIGYSGGAMLAGDTAAEIGRGDHGPTIQNKVTAVALVADPAQPRGQAANGSFGVTGSRDIHGVPARWTWDERDPIPCTPELSPLRTIADQTAAMSLVDPAAWTVDLLDRLRRGRWQPSAWNWWDIAGSIRRYSEAAAQASYYLTGGHVAAYIGWQMDATADWLTEVA